MKKILVPCDFSNTSLQAFRFACEIATKSKGEIYLLHVTELPTMPNTIFAPVRGYENVFLNDIRKKAKQKCDTICERWAGKLKVHLIFDQGSVSSAILNVIERKRTDLVIMGTHGASGIRDFTIGSNTEKIVRLSKVPVISIRKSVKVSSIKHIIFPTRMDITEKALINGVKNLQQFFKATLQILYVNTPSLFTRDIDTEIRLIEFIKQYQFKNCSIHVFNDYNEESGISNFSAKFKNKMIAMGTHGRKGISHLISGSIAEDVINHFDCPIWTLKEK